MRFKDYLDHIHKLVKENPEVLEMDTYYGIDDEGNGFEAIGHLPSVMFMDENGEAASVEDENPDDFMDYKKVMVVN